MSNEILLNDYKTNTYEKCNLFFHARENKWSINDIPKKIEGTGSN